MNNDLHKTPLQRMNTFVNFICNVDLCSTSKSKSATQELSKQITNFSNLITSPEFSRIEWSNKTKSQNIGLFKLFYGFWFFKYILKAEIGVTDKHQYRTIVNFQLSIRSLLEKVIQTLVNNDKIDWLDFYQYLDKNQKQTIELFSQFQPEIEQLHKMNSKFDII